jgi:anaerobic magnesium-protoporphyrin IX monomethyl ester cyclase
METKSSLPSASEGQLSPTAGPRKDVVILFFPNPSPGDSSQYRIPYSLLYLERALRDLDLEIILLDEQVEPDYSKILVEKRDRLLLVGVSTLTGEQISGGIAFSKKVRECSNASIVWGGWHPTLLPEQTLQEPFIDFVVVGQGERPLRLLIEHLIDGREPSDIAGVAYKRGGKIIVNRGSPFENINAFPRINFRLLDMRKYFNQSRLPEHFIGYFATHGCPLDCSFCCIGEIYHRRWQHKPVEQIIDELRYLKEEVGVDSLLFEDDNFFVNAKFAREFAQALIDAKLDLKWETSAHAHIFTKAYTADDVRLFAQSGCRQIYIGAESGDQEVLNLLDKHLEIQETMHFVEMLCEQSITPRLTTMVCLPTDSGRDFDMTVDLLCRVKLMEHSVRASIFYYTPYPGTRLYQRAKEKGFVPPQRLDAWCNHTLRKFRAPWAPKGIDWRLEYFANFYLPLADSRFYRLVRSRKIRPIVFLVNKLFYPFARLRLKMKYFRFPIEAISFLSVLRVYNKLTGSTFCLGNGSYVDEHFSA